MSDELLHVPRPNEQVDGATVVASTVAYDGPERPASWLLLLLRPVAPYFDVVELTTDGQLAQHGQFENIVPAVECYQNNGGDY